MSSPESLSFACPSCGLTLHVPAHLAGATGPCPSCQSLVTAPLQTTLPVSNAAAPSSDSVLRQSTMQTPIPPAPRRSPDQILGYVEPTRTAPPLPTPPSVPSHTMAQEAEPQRPTIPLPPPQPKQVEPTIPLQLGRETTRPQPLAEAQSPEASVASEQSESSPAEAAPKTKKSPSKKGLVLSLAVVGLGAVGSGVWWKMGHRTGDAAPLAQTQEDLNALPPDTPAMRQKRSEKSAYESLTAFMQVTTWPEAKGHIIIPKDEVAASQAYEGRVFQKFKDARLSKEWFADLGTTGRFISSWQAEAPFGGGRMVFVMEETPSGSRVRWDVTEQQLRGTFQQFVATPDYPPSKLYVNLLPLPTQSGDDKVHVEVQAPFPGPSPTVVRAIVSKTANLDQLVKKEVTSSKRALALLSKPMGLPDGYVQVDGLFKDAWAEVTAPSEPQFPVPPADNKSILAVKPKPAPVKPAPLEETPTPVPAPAMAQMPASTPQAVALSKPAPSSAPNLTAKAPQAAMVATATANVPTSGATPAAPPPQIRKPSPTMQSSTISNPAATTVPGLTATSVSVAPPPTAPQPSPKSQSPARKEKTPR